MNYLCYRLHESIDQGRGFRFLQFSIATAAQKAQYCSCGCVWLALLFDPSGFVYQYMSVYVAEDDLHPATNQWLRV